jgi:hypothetical protein
MVWIVIAVAFCGVAWKFVFWSGHFPPKWGWSPRQLRRMRHGRSPWWL